MKRLALIAARQLEQRFWRFVARKVGAHIPARSGVVIQGLNIRHEGNGPALRVDENDSVVLPQGTEVGP